MTDERPQPDPLALAMEWVAKITTVGLEMVLPAIGGAYLDKRFGTSYWALAGLVLPLLAATGLVMYWNRVLRHKWKHLRVAPGR